MHVAADEEGAGFAEEDVDDGHVEEVFGGGDVRALDAVAEEDVGQDYEVDVGAVRWQQDYRAFATVLVGF